MTATPTKQSLRTWRVLRKVWSDADFNGVDEQVVQSGQTHATDEEMRQWSGTDAGLRPDNMEEFLGNGANEGSYTLQVLDGDTWKGIGFFYLNVYTCTECGREVEAVVSSEQMLDDNFVPDHDC